MDNLNTYANNTWCPGCGNFAIFNAIKKVIKNLESKNVLSKNIVMTAGIGCHGKIFDYLNVSGFYSLHGRAIATAQGIKLANPDLKVIAFVGDGDSYGEGLSHLIFAAKRNADITVLVHNNGVYGLTTGQVSPVSLKGFKGPSTPDGSIEKPLNQIALLAEAGASFIARGYSAKLEHLSDIILKAILHEGFSYIDILQPCVTFNNTYDEYNNSVEILETPVSDADDVVKISKRKGKIPIGIFRRDDGA